MKYYLSSFKLGRKTQKLKELIKNNPGKYLYIPNALDFVGVDLERRKTHVQADMDDFRKCGGEIEELDLRDYFGKTNELYEILNKSAGVYISGGNTFVLRQAMKLSGFDNYVLDNQSRDNFLYVAYSAGVCLLSPDLHVYAITDDSNNFPYEEIKDTVWDGLGIINFAFEPHFDSDHPESASTDKEIKYCIENKILFKAFRDGEVMIL